MPQTLKLLGLQNFLCSYLHRVMPSMPNMFSKEPKKLAGLLKDAILCEGINFERSCMAAFNEATTRHIPFSNEDPRSGNRYILPRPEWQIFSTYLDDGRHEILLEGRNYRNFKLKKFHANQRIGWYEGNLESTGFQILYHEDGLLARINFDFKADEYKLRKRIVWTKEMGWKVLKGGSSRGLHVSDIPDLKRAQEVVTWQVGYLNGDKKKAVA